MSFLSGIFGGGGDDEPTVQPMAEAEEDRQDIDPNLEAGLSEAKKARRASDARTGRSDLVTSRGGISIVGGQAYGRNR